MKRAGAPPRALAGAALLGCALACGASIPLVPKGPHPAHVQEFVVVAFPPPPAVVEELTGGASDPRCAWVDGHYTWDGRRWSWQAGRWVLPPTGCYYAEPVVAWAKAGEPRLYFTPPRWYRNDAVERTEKTARCAEPVTCKR